MCGIYGYVGTELAFPIIINALKKLEYRGHDSWGITTLDDDFHTIKQVGGVDENASGTYPGNVGIGHVRWATSGTVSERNAHPHFDCKNEIAIVHNGVIYNEAHLKSKLKRRGHNSIISDTDSELFVHLLEENTNRYTNFVEDIHTTLNSLEAQYAFLILRKNTKKIYAVRYKSPIWIGVGNGGYHISSDIVSLVGKASEYMNLEDGDIAEIGIDGIRIYNSDMNLIKRDLKPLNITPESVEKGDNLYHYLKEVEEIKCVVEGIIERYVNGNIVDIGIDLNIFKGANRIILTGAGSSYFASMVGEYYMRQLLGIVNVESVISSELELKYADIDFPQKTILIALTQSGETKDTKDAIEFAKEKGITIVSLINQQHSEAENLSDFVIKLLARVEISVPATKTFVAELLVLLLLSISFSENERKYEILDEIKKLPHNLSTVFNENEIISIAEKYYHEEAIWPLSRGFMVPVALEAGRKIEEVLYVNSIGTSMGISAELKHGPLTLVKDKVMLFLIPPASSHNKIITTIDQVNIRGAKIIVVATQGDEIIENLVKENYIDDAFWIPKTHESIAPILYIAPLYLLIYYMAIMKKKMDNQINPDRPRYLAKSITVD